MQGDSQDAGAASVAEGVTDGVLGTAAAAAGVIAAGAATVVTGGAAPAVVAVILTTWTALSRLKSAIEHNAEHHAHRAAYQEKVELLMQRCLAIKEKLETIPESADISKQHLGTLAAIFDDIQEFAETPPSRIKTFFHFKKIDESFASFHRKLDSAVGDLELDIQFDHAAHMRAIQEDVQAFSRLILQKLEATANAGAGESKGGESDETADDQEEEALTREELIAMRDDLAAYQVTLDGIAPDISSIRDGLARLLNPEYNFERYTQFLKERWANPTVRLFGGEEMPVQALYVSGQLRMVQIGSRDESQVAQMDGAFSSLVASDEQQVIVELSSLLPPKGETAYISCTAPAGLGKTMHAKELLRRWATGEIGEHIPWVFYFPLKKIVLAFDEHRNYSFEEIMWECFFKNVPGGAISLEETNAFCKYIRENPECAFFVVEGADEVGHSVAQTVLSSVTNALVTSRSPTQTSQVVTRVTAERFDSSQREQFIQRVFAFFAQHPLTVNAEVVDERTDEGLVEWLGNEDHAHLIEGLCDTPLILQMVCELWRDPSVELFNEENFSMYKLFEAITSKIMLRFLENHQATFGVNFVGEGAAEHAQHLLPDRKLGQLLQFAERLAYESYRDGNVPLFDDALIDSVIVRYPGSTDGSYVTSEHLKALGFFEQVIALACRGGVAHEFLHMKLREHMAGKVLAQLLSSEEETEVEEARAYIEANKFNPEFVPVLEHACAGLANSLDALNTLFETLLTGKRDLYGYAELKTLLVCADACGWPEDLAIRANLLSGLGDCLTNFIGEKKFVIELARRSDNCVRLISTSSYGSGRMTFAQLRGASQILNSCLATLAIPLLGTTLFQIGGEDHHREILMNVLRSWMLLVRLPKKQDIGNARETAVEGATQSAEGDEVRRLSQDDQLVRRYRILCGLNVSRALEASYRFMLTEVIVSEFAKQGGNKQSTLKLLACVLAGVQRSFSKDVWKGVWAKVQIHVPTNEVSDVLACLHKWLLDLENEAGAVISQGACLGKIFFPNENTEEVFDRIYQCASELMAMFVLDEDEKNTKVSLRMIAVICIIAELQLSEEQEAQYQQLLADLFSSDQVDVMQKIFIWDTALESDVLPSLGEEESLRLLSEIERLLGEVGGGVETANISVGEYADLSEVGANLCRFLSSVNVPQVHIGRKQALLDGYAGSFKVVKVLGDPARMVWQDPAVVSRNQAARKHEDTQRLKFAEKVQAARTAWNENRLLAFVDEDPVAVMGLMREEVFSFDEALPLVRQLLRKITMPIGDANQRDAQKSAKPEEILQKLLCNHAEYFKAFIACYGAEGAEDLLQEFVLFESFITNPETVICRIPETNRVYWHVAGSRYEQECENAEKLEEGLRLLKEMNYLPQVNWTAWVRAKRAAVSFMGDFFGSGASREAAASPPPVDETTEGQWMILETMTQIFPATPT